MDDSKITIPKCAWCDKIMSVKNLEEDAKKEIQVSHGICSECLDIFFENKGKIRKSI